MSANLSSPTAPHIKKSYRYNPLSVLAPMNFATQSCKSETSKMIIGYNLGQVPTEGSHTSTRDSRTRAILKVILPQLPFSRYGCPSSCDLGGLCRPKLFQRESDHLLQRRDRKSVLPYRGRTGIARIRQARNCGGPYLVWGSVGLVVVVSALRMAIHRPRFKAHKRDLFLPNGVARPVRGRSNVWP